MVSRQSVVSIWCDKAHSGLNQDAASINIGSIAESAAALDSCGQSLISLINPLSTGASVNTDDARWSNGNLPGLLRESIPRLDRTVIASNDVVNKLVTMVNTLRATQEFILSERFTDEILQKIIRSDGFAKKLEEGIDGTTARKQVESEDFESPSTKKRSRKIELEVSERDLKSTSLILWAGTGSQVVPRALSHRHPPR